MAEIEVTPDNENQVAIEVDEPEIDAVAREAAKINTLVDANSGVNPVERLSKPDYDPIGDFVEGVEKHRADQILRNRQLLTDAGMDTTASEAEIKAYRDDLGGTRGNLGLYRQKALELKQGVPDESVDELAFSLMYRMELAQEFEDVTLGETVADVGGTMIPLRETYNIQQLASDLGFLDSIGDNAKALIDPGSTMDRLRQVAMNLTPEDRAKMFNDVMVHLEDLDNNMIKQQIVQGIFSGNYNPDVMRFWNTVDAVDVIGAISGLTKVAGGLTRAGKMSNIVRKNPTLEGHEFLSVVARDPQMSKVGEVSPADVADLQNPVIHGDLGADLTGAPEDVASEITAMWETQNKRVEALNERSLREGVLTGERQLEIMREAEEELRNNRYVKDLKTEKTDTGFTIKFTEQEYDPATGEMVSKKGTKIVDFTVDDQGKVDVDLDRDYVQGWLRFDPNSRFKGRIREQLVKAGEAITREQGKVINTLNRMLNDAYKDLSKKEAIEMDNLLRKGSQEKQEYSYRDLKGMGYSDKMIKAYMGQRNVTYQLYNLENQKLVDDMISEGVRLVDIDGEEVAARAFEDPKQAREAYRTFDSDSWSVIIADDGLPQGKAGTRLDFERASDFTGDVLEEAYEKGFQLVKNYHHQTRFSKGESITEWALVRPNRILHPRGRQVINRIPGYVPKQRTDSFYFVKTKKDAPVSNPKRGEEGVRKTEMTVAWSDNVKDAEAYAKSLGDDYYVAFDREIDPQKLKGDLLLTRGGLFGGKRKAEELPFIGKDDALGFESSLDMMERYINHIGRQIPAHLWRLGNEKRVVERAKELMPEASIRNINDVMPQAEERFTRGSKEHAFLKDMVEQIQNINAIPTADERAMAKRYERIGNMFEGIKGLEWLAKYFYRASQRNLSIGDKIRGVTFTHMLGMYNPAQFLVQASGSFVAFAVNPVAALKSIPKLIGWQVLDGFAKDPVSQKKAADWFRSQGMGDYADSYMVWVKSGFREAVIDSNSDIATLFGNKPYNAGVLQRAAANNRMFYEMGELTMSRASVATAVEWYKSVNKLKKIDIKDEKALKTIYRRAEMYRLNMGRANMSDLNKGWKAVPLQFQQVISKYYEKVLPKNLGGTDELTASEKIRLFAIPTAMTGAVAVPGSSFVVEQIASLTGTDLTKLSEDEAQLFRAGAIGWSVSEALDMNVDFASRMALGSDVWKRIWDSASAGGGSVFASLMGPAGNVGTRYTQGAQYLWKAIDLTTELETFTADEAELVGKVLVDTLLSLPSGTRNIKDYLPHILAGNEAFIKDGRYLWDWEDMNKQTAIMAAFGFQPNEMIDLYELANQMRTSSRPQVLKWTNTDADVISHIIHTGILGTDSEDEQKLKTKIIQAILNSYEPAEKQKLLNKVFDNLNDPEKDVNQMFHNLRIHNMTHMEEGLNFINRLVSRKNKELAETE